MAWAMMGIASEERPRSEARWVAKWEGRRGEERSHSIRSRREREES
jgi:hypothetical protein